MVVVLLSDGDLERALREGELCVDPLAEGCVQPSSVDLRLDRWFRVFSRSRWTHIDPREAQAGLTREVEVLAGECFVLHPGEFALGSTFERVELGAGLAARLEGKSSLGRLGLVVHSTAGFVDPGFGGHITLELSNVSGLPVRLWPSMPIGQLCVIRLSSPALRPYGSAGLGSKYQGQERPVASRYYLNGGSSR